MTNRRQPKHYRTFSIVTAAIAAGALISPSAASAEPTSGPTLAEALAALPVVAEERDGYDRDLFKHWVDADRDRCNTRMEVLITEASLHLSSPACIPCC
ncbi:hypothetical protein [Glycomyces sp. YM15]|uniref:hypothetical protein n=1 Tax=Glycomyces sp. YM15 TaxID=2800446 RepID=UPI001965C1BC|nr:hypothetical protein [Glycomyces sp. YM15]